MAKRIWAFGALLLLAGCVYLYGNLTLGKEVLGEIDQLLAKGRNELEPCQQFKTELQEISGNDLHSESPSHANKKQSLAVLALLENYPGTPPSHYKAARLFIENNETLARRVDQIPLVIKHAELEGECDISAMMVHGQLLLKDIKVFGFSPIDADRVRRMLANYVGSDTPSNMMLGLAIRATLLQKQLESGTNPDRKTLAARAGAFLEEFEKKREQVHREWEKGGRWQLYFLSSYAPEINAMSELNHAYATLLADTKIQPPSQTHADLIY